MWTLSFWGNVATWAGALASAAAAWAAFRAARVALNISMKQGEREAAQRAATANALGPALMLELCLAENDATALAVTADCTAATQNPKVFVLNCGGSLLRRTFLAEAIISDLVIFNEDGAMLTSAAASVLDLRAAMDAWKSYLAQHEGVRLTQDDAAGMVLFAASSRDCTNKVGAAIAALERRGVTVPQEIVRKPRAQLYAGTPYTATVS